MVFGEQQSLKSYILTCKGIAQTTMIHRVFEPQLTREPIIIEQDQNTDIKYQNIIYCMCNRTKCVSYTDQVSIDLLTAINELNGLDWTWKNNGISFFNLKTDDNVFCHRLKKDKWFVATKATKDGVYSGFQWISHPDNESLISTVRLFFEELSWFDLLNWNMVRWESDFGI